MNRFSNKKSSSKHKGISWHKGHRKWQARIQVNLKERHLGYFANEEAAALAYNIAAIEHFGEFARKNLI